MGKGIKSTVAYTCVYGWGGSDDSLVYRPCKIFFSPIKGAFTEKCIVLRNLYKIALNPATKTKQKCLVKPLFFQFYIMLYEAKLRYLFWHQIINTFTSHKFLFHVYQ